MKKKLIYYYVLIKTNSYAGNFLRELCAHLTGQLGVCNVGEEYALEAKKELGASFKEFIYRITTVSDDYGDFRPVGLGRNSNDVEIYFYECPTAQMIEIMKDRIKTFKSKSKDFEDIEFYEIALYERFEIEELHFKEKL